MEEEYEPPSNDDHDETNEMYNLAADEEAAKEMEEFLEALEKNDVSGAIKREMKRKLEATTVKLSGLFKEQRELIVEEEEEEPAPVALVKQPSMTAAAALEEKSNRKQDHMKQLLLQKKVTMLDNQVELSQQKARSVTAQW